MGSDGLMGVGYSPAATKNFETREQWWLRNIVNLLNVTELFILNLLNLYHVISRQYIVKY